MVVSTALIGLPPANAQGLSLDAGSPGKPIEVRADSGIEWQQKAQVYIARGHAVATRGDTQVDADVLIAHYRKAKGSTSGTEIYRLDADGNVVIKEPSRTIVGDHAVYDADQAIAVVTGKGLKLTTPTDVVTARNSLEWYDRRQIGVARGDAVVTRGEKTIKADVLTAYMTKGAGKPGAAKAAAKSPRPSKTSAKGGGGAAETSSISRVDAQGHVVVTNGSDIGHGDYGVYNAKTGIVTLIGHVLISRGRDVIKGQYAVMDLNNNVSRILTAARRSGQAPGRVEGLFIRQDSASGAARAGRGEATPERPKR